jgi:hypothetical protein
MNLGHFVVLFFFFFFFFCFVRFCSILLFPFEEKTTEQKLRHHIQDWRLRDEHKISKTEILMHLNLETFFIFIYIFLFTYFLFLFFF